LLLSSFSHISFFLLDHSVPQVPPPPPKPKVLLVCNFTTSLLLTFQHSHSAWVVFSSFRLPGTPTFSCPPFFRPFGNWLARTVKGIPGSFWTTLFRPLNVLVEIPFFFFLADKWSFLRSSNLFFHWRYHNKPLFYPGLKPIHTVRVSIFFHGVPDLRRVPLLDAVRLFFHGKGLS